MYKSKAVTITGAALSVLLLASACSSSKKSTNPPAGGGSTASSGKNYKLTFIQGVAGDAFYVTMACGIDAEAKKLGNVTVTTQGPAKFDPTLQTPILQAATAAKPDAILIAPTDVSALQQPVDDAISRGIKVVLVDTTLKDPSKAVSQISSDNNAGGAAAFTAIKQLVPGGGKVLTISTQPGISTTDARLAGFKAAVAADSSFTDLGVQYDQDTASVAASETVAALSKNPDIVGIFATNLFSAEGAATGVKQAGKSGKIKIVGFDAGPDQVKALQDGTVQALVAQQPYTIGTDGVDQAVAALEGKTTTPKIGTEFTVITQANLSSAASQAALYKASC
jgi:ribose transport system substrate-binding protein